MKIIIVAGGQVDALCSFLDDSYSGTAVLDKDKMATIFQEDNAFPKISDNCKSLYRRPEDFDVYNRINKSEIDWIGLRNRMEKQWRSLPTFTENDIMVAGSMLFQWLYELPRKPRMLASGMNWQNIFKKHLTKSKYYGIIGISTLGHSGINACGDG